jgi:hypothetical protein
MRRMHAPFFAPQRFDDPAEALARVHEIHAASVAYLRDALRGDLAGWPSNIPYRSSSGRANSRSRCTSRSPRARTSRRRSTPGGCIEMRDLLLERIMRTGTDAFR